MSELGDLLALHKAVDATLDEHDAKLKAQDAKLSEHDRALAETDRMEKHLINLIEGLRDQVIEGFRQLRIARNGR